MDIQAYGANPGTTALVQTAESFIWTGRELRNETAMLGIAAAAVDAGNSPTTYLRAGLVMGKITASGLLKEYNPAGTDGSQIAYCVLVVGQSTLNSSGTAAITNGHVLLKGILVAENLLLLDAQARRQLLQSGRYIFADDLTSKHNTGGGMIQEVNKAADYTVVAADAGTLFTASAAAVFTLPAIAAGLGPFEFLNLADANMGVLSAEGDNIVWVHDLSADSLTFSTASNKIGGRLQVQANAAGTKWLVRNLSPVTCLVTVVT